MGLFYQFTDTLFLKSDSDLERKIMKLEEMNKINDNPLIERDLHFFKAGLSDEKSLEFEMKNNNFGIYILHDIHLKFEEFQAQIDYVVYTPAHCYLIECKNMIGNIKINNQGQFSREFVYKNKKIKEAIYSPVTQALRHKEIFKKIWSTKKSQFEDYYKPLVVFMNSKGILNMKYAPKEIKKMVIRADQLNDYLKKDLQQVKLKDSKKDMEKYAHNMLSLHQNILKEDCSKYQIKSTIDRETIKQKLINFRKEKAHKNNITAHYIFNNKQLKLLLTHLPKDTVELNHLKILEPVKVNFYMIKKSLISLMRMLTFKLTY